MTRRYALNRSTGKQKGSAKVDHGWCGKRSSDLSGRLPRLSGDQRHYDKLQTDQCASGATDYQIETFPFHELMHRTLHLSSSSNANRESE